MTRVSAWMYLFYGTDIIQSKFDEAKDGSFEVLAPDKRYVFVSSSKHLRELDTAPDTVLSLQAASKQMLQPQYAMHSFNWFDRRGTEGVGFVRALRTLLTNNIPQILPNLSILITSSLTDVLAEHPNVDAQIGAVIQRFLSSHKAVYEVLLPIADQRCLQRDLGKLGGELPKHACIQWIMETSPRKAPWSGKRVVHELMAIWLGSVHALTTTITFAIRDLCLHPEYAEPLRAELEAEYKNFLQTGQGLPLLDSFIKESARLTPVESTLGPFQFSDGTKLSPGDWACTPVRAIMQNEALYPAPLEFHGFRFVDRDNVSIHTPEGAQRFQIQQEKPSSLCSADATWHVWGSGRMVCPGRYYAAAVMKVILAQIIRDYDCSLVDPAARRWFTWRSTTLPGPGTKVVFSPRQDVSRAVSGV
ncbi:hypothetical protein ASPCAL09650 [Aspergillus calidoustus]|uniref:Cytochrome P450 n=1 Tax=Aspergillus calidoustus TaxID=454130 RepID=A0A0U5CB55_ASPCI|nr:hypothetical protein ASPCAL09650 [Aspergillus calidoustus]